MIYNGIYSRRRLGSFGILGNSDNMKNRKTDEEILKELEELNDTFALKVVRVGSDEINFNILEILPSNIETMMRVLHLTKVPVNNRVNLLEDVRLVKRFKGTGYVEITDLGKFFLDKIRTSEDMVRDHIVSIARKFIE